MSACRSRIVLASIIALSGAAGIASGQSSAPGWVQMFDQGEVEPRLKGISTPRGVTIDIVAEGPTTDHAEGLTFDDRGVPYVLTTKADKRSAELFALHDADGNGRFEKSEVVMSDLPAASSVLFHDGFFYLAGGGSVLRRTRNDADVLKRLQAAAEIKQTPSAAITADGKWIEQTLLRGLSAKPEDSPGGLAVGFGGWIYLSVGGTAIRAESWDGSKATILGSGAIVRFRADGSHVQEFARGLAEPAVWPACDLLGNIFQADRFGNNWRLIHVLEGGDYGWRNDIQPPRLDRPGTLPAMLHTESGALGGVMAYQGAAFPKFFKGLLLITDAERHRVRAVLPQSADCTFAAGQQFDLLRSDDSQFRPASITRGPDDAIYLFDVRDAGKSRLLRLTWSGSKDAAAIAPLPLTKRDAATSTAERLTSALDKSKEPAQQAAALSAACQAWDKTVHEACIQLLVEHDPVLERLAADALGDHLPDDKEAQEQMAGLMQDRLLAAPLPVRRSLYIALGKLGTKLDSVPEWIFEATSVTPEQQTNRHLFDGHVRAAEMPKGWATELLLGNLEVALFDPNPEPDERQRLKKFVVATAEAMRTRELADFLDKLIRDKKDYFSKLEAPLQARVLPAYRNVLVDPPIHADTVAEWLAKHPAAAAEVQRAAWETLAAVGTSKPDSVIELVKAGLESGKLDPTLKPSILAALERHRNPKNPSQIDELLRAVKKVESKPK